MFYRQREMVFKRNVKMARKTTKVKESLAPRYCI